MADIDKIIERAENDANILAIGLKDQATILTKRRTNGQIWTSPCLPLTRTRWTLKPG